MIKFVAVHPGIVNTHLTPHWVKANALTRFMTAGGEGGMKKSRGRVLESTLSSNRNGVIDEY